METPCLHHFHKGCLVKWMQMKLECPTCRQNLPPISPFMNSEEEEEEVRAN
jgi:hypothetical protein